MDPRKGIQAVCELILTKDIKNSKSIIDEFHKKVLDYFYSAYQTPPTAEQQEMVVSVFNHEYNKIAEGIDRLKTRRPGSGNDQKTSLAGISFDINRIKLAVVVLSAIRTAKIILCRLTMKPAPTPLHIGDWDLTNIMESIKKQVIDTLDSLMILYTAVTGEEVKQDFAAYVVALRDFLRLRF
jgi:hypothetical protein